MRVGRVLETAIRLEEEAEHGIRLRRVRHLIAHPVHPWALTSLDFERIGERCIVEAKTSASRSWDDGPPEHVEAQARWQMGVAGYPRCHVVALRYGSELACFDYDHDERAFQGMLAIAHDFRQRLAAGGPFAETRASMRRAFPTDDGTEIVADEDMAEAIRALLETRRQIGLLSDHEDRLTEAIQTRMGPASAIRGDGFRVTWRRTRESHHTDWESIADGLLRQLPEDQRAALVGIHTETRPGSRRFVVREEKHT